VNITATLFGQIIAFVLLIYFVEKVLWAPLSTMLEDRQKRISDGLAAGEKGKHELELAEKKAQQEIKEAKDKASEIIALAEKRGSEIVEEAKQEARTEGERIVTAANAELEREVNRAKEALRSQVADLAVAGASKILKKEIDAASHKGIIAKLVTQI